MTWIRLEDVQAALSRASVMADSVFIGRTGFRPQASFVAIANPTTFAVDFTDTSVDPSGSTLISWAWDFGDEATSTTQNPSHTYTAAGTYLVTLTVTNSSGHSGQSQAFQQFVDQPQTSPPELVGPVAGFTSIVASRTVTFTDTSTDTDGTIQTWTWNFGDGPIADFTSVATNLAVQFTDASTDPGGTITSRSWDFGDGTMSTSTNPSHTYPLAGSYNVTLTCTDNHSNSGSISKQVVVTSSVVLGAPFVVFEGLQSNTALKVNTAPFDTTADQPSPANIISRLSAAQLGGWKLYTAMTGGAHSNYTTISSTLSGFDLVKWKAKMDTFNTPAIKAAVASSVSGGWLVCNSLLDEPQHFTWGSLTATPPGGLTKPVLDQMHDYAATIFPSLPHGVSMGGRYDWRASESWTKVDFVNYQYSYLEPTGDPSNVTRFRDLCLAQAGQDGTNIVFGLNVLDGGIPGGGCTQPTSGGTGTFSNRCRMTSAQVLNYGTCLANAGAGLSLWRYDSTFMANASNVTSFNSLKAVLAARPLRSLRRGA